MADVPLTDAEALAVLDWYRGAGVDIAVGDEPVDRFATSAAAPAKRILPAAAGPAPAPLPAAPRVTDPGATRAIAAAEARIMMVGEGPGENEDKQGKPFVGRAGQLLDHMLGAIGLDRTKVYIANMVPWRPPGNRNPTPDELAQCAPFLHRQVELVNPKLLVTLGNVPTQALFATSQGITRMRGQWKTLEINTWAGPALPTLHPAFLLRTPSAKAQAWKDMLSLKAAMAREGL